MQDIYQLLPPLSAEEYESLKSDIALRGVLVPIEKDEAGNILDGHHRLRICDELGITDYPVTIRVNLSEAEKRAHVYALNLNRRHLTAEQRRPLFVAMRQDGMSVRQIADLAGVGVATVHREISTVPNGTVEMPERIVGKDGKSRPAIMPPSKPLTVVAKSAGEAEKALDLFPKMDMDGLSTDSPFTVKDVRKEARRQDRQEIAAMSEPEEAEESKEAPLVVLPGEWWRLGNHLLFCGDSSSREFIDNAPACPFAFADPPYNVGKAEWDSSFTWAHDYLPNVAEVVAVTPGTKGLQTFFAVAKMPYRWIFTAWIKNGMTVGGMGFQNCLHAFLFSHGSVHRNEQDFMDLVIDVSQTTDTAHPTRKPMKFVARLLQIYSAEGDSVIDPFLGSGTTLFAAEQLGRCCYGAEMNPDYATEIISRWSAMTGQSPTKEGF